MEENEFGALEEESPQSHHNYLQDTMSHGMSNNMAQMVSASMRMQGPMAAPSQLMSNQHLIQQPI